MNILTRIFAVFTLTLTISAAPARAENLALVLSFENYTHGRDAQGALSQHDALLEAYRAAGFHAISGRDRTDAQIRNRVEAFLERLNAADKVVIHLSGHVVHFGQASWILPSDIEARSVADIEAFGTSIDFLLQLLAIKPNNSILFAGSATRNFANIPGVSRGVSLSGMPNGVLMISGVYSNLNRAVIDDFLGTGHSVSEALQENSRRLASMGNVPRNLTLGTNPFQDDINREAALHLTSAQKRDIQHDLIALGFEIGRVDGVFGSRTRSAIRGWQQRDGRRVTGYLNAGQINRISRLADEGSAGGELPDRDYWSRTGALGTEAGLRAYLRRFPEGVYAGRARWELENRFTSSEDDDWREAARVNTFRSYNRYLADYPRGIYRDIANQRIRELGEIIDDSDMGPVDPQPALTEARLNLNNISRILVETRLGDLGYSVGTRDGVFDAQARRAIAQYQRDRGMEAHGYVNSDMIRRLLLNL